LRSLPSHAARAGLIDDLLADDHYLLYADLVTVQHLANRATSETGRQRERLLRLSPRDVLTADPANRAAIFSVTEALENAPYAYARAAIRTPYRAVWAAALPSAEYSVLRGHDDWINDVCAITFDGTTYLATASSDGTVRIWDPATGTTLRTLTGHDAAVNAICAFTLDGATLLATASSDRTARIWDPAGGTSLHTLTGHGGWVWSVCAFTLDGTALLATASDDHTAQIWDPASGTSLHTLTGHEDEVKAVCAFTLEGATLLATVSDDGGISSGVEVGYLG
jgi:WD40 repeat protein